MFLIQILKTLSVVLTPARKRSCTANPCMSVPHTGPNHLHVMWATRLLTLAAHHEEADMRPYRLPQCLLSAHTLSLALAGPVSERTHR